MMSLLLCVCLILGASEAVSYSMYVCMYVCQSSHAAGLHSGSCWQAICSHAKQLQPCSPADG